MLAGFALERGRGQVLQIVVWTDLVVVVAPSLDQNACLAARAEPLDGQALVAELAVVAFVSPVLPRLARIVEHRGPICLTQDRDHLLFSESTLSHRLLADWEPSS